MRILIASLITIGASNAQAMTCWQRAPDYVQKDKRSDESVKYFLESSNLVAIVQVKGAINSKPRTKFELIPLEVFKGNPKNPYFHSVAETKASELRTGQKYLIFYTGRVNKDGSTLSELCSAVWVVEGEEMNFYARKLRELAKKEKSAEPTR